MPLYARRFIFKMCIKANRRCVWKLLAFILIIGTRDSVRFTCAMDITYLVNALRRRLNRFIDSAGKTVISIICLRPIHIALEWSDTLQQNFQKNKTFVRQNPQIAILKPDIRRKNKQRHHTYNEKTMKSLKDGKTDDTLQKNKPTN